MGMGGRIQGRCRITWTKTWGQVRVRLERGRQVVFESRARECGHTTYHASVMLQKHLLIMSTVSLKINPFTHQTSYSIQTIHLQNRPTVSVSTHFQPPMALWVWPIDVEAVQQWTNLNSQSSKEKHIKGCNKCAYMAYCKMFNLPNHTLRIRFWGISLFSLHCCKEASFIHVSGGQNCLLPTISTMDMAKVGGPLSVVKVCTSMLCVKIGYRKVGGLLLVVNVYAQIWTSQVHSPLL